MTMEFWLLAVAITVAAMGAVSDVLSARIPNRLTYTAIVAALLTRLIFLGPRSFFDGLAGLLLGGGLFFLLFMIHAMGGGDVKLMAAVGAWVGFRNAGTAVIVCSLFGGLMALTYMAVLKRYRTTLHNVISLVQFHLRMGAKPNPELNLSSPGAVRMPYGVAIAAGALGTLISTTWKA